MYHLVDNLQNRSGDALANHYVKLKDEDGNYATLYADANLTPISAESGVANAAKTDANGMYRCYVADGEYVREFYSDEALTALVVSVPITSMFTPGGILDELASTDTGKGAALVGFKQAGTGAVARTAQTELRETLKVTQFMGELSVTEAIQAAVDRLAAIGGGDLIFPPGSYTLTAPIEFDGISNIRLIGYGATLAATSRFAGYLQFTNCSNVLVEGLRFDLAKSSLATYTAGDYPTKYNVGVQCLASCDNVIVRNCRFSNLYTIAVQFYGSSNLEVSGCYFLSPLQEQDQILSFVEGVTVAGLINVHGNRFYGAATTRNDRSPSAVAFSGVTGSITIRDNYAEHCGRNNAGTHRLGCFDIYADAINVTITGNTAKNCREQFLRLAAVKGALVQNNHVTIAAEADTTYSALTIESASSVGLVGNQKTIEGVRIIDNEFTDAAQRQAYCIGVLSYDWGGPCVDVEITGNKISGCNTAFYVEGPFNGLRISKNTVSDVLAFYRQAMQDSGGTDLVLTTTLGSQATSIVDGLRIDDNDVTLRAGSATVPVSISVNRTTAFTGTVGNIWFNRNRIRCSGPGTTITLNVIVNASVAQGVFEARNNVIAGYTTPFLLRSMVRAVLNDNHAAGFTALLEAGSTGYGTLDAIGNRRTNDPRKGTATLVGGTVTVNTAEIMAGDVVRITRLTIGGTPGNLDLGAITAGTSFVIDSDNAADTSVVEWEIVGR